MNESAAVRSGIRRSIGETLDSAIVAAVVSLLASCAAPQLSGPYYRPQYPQASRDVRIVRDHAGIQREIVISAGLCRMSLKAEAGRERVVLVWRQSEWPHREEKRCRFRVHDEPLQLEDLDTGNRRQIATFQRTFMKGPGLDVDRAVSLSSLIPGFAAVPVSERRYALSIQVERTFSGSLPDEARVQIPEIELGERRIRPPPLRLKRYQRSGKGWWYAPAGSGEIAPTRPAGKSLGGGRLAFKPADVWHERPSTIRLSASFRGNPYGWNRDGSRNDAESRIGGEVYFEFFQDLPVKLADDRVVWRVPGDDEERALPIRNSMWELKNYTTVNLTESLDHLPDYSNPSEPYDDRDRTFLAEIPGFRPDRFRVTLPSIELNGRAWSLRPIDFEYHAVGVGVWTYP